MNVVADPVPRTREPRAVLGGHRLQEAMVVRILEIDLENVVVDVDDGRLDAYALLAEELELHHRHRPRRVLRERLVDAEPDLLAGNELSALEVVFEDRASDRCRRQGRALGTTRLERRQRRMPLSCPLDAPLRRTGTTRAPTPAGPGWGPAYSGARPRRRTSPRRRPGDSRQAARVGCRPLRVGCRPLVPQQGAVPPDG